MMFLLFCLLLTGCAVVPIIGLGGVAIAGYTAAGKGGPSGLIADMKLKYQIKKSWQNNGLSVLPMLIKGNTVMLCGYYGGDIKKHIELASKPGVRVLDHTQRLKVDPDFSQDVLLKARIMTSLLAGRYTNSRNYELTVIDHVVYVIATVFSLHEKEELIRCIESTDGIRHFESHIEIKPAPLKILG